MELFILISVVDRTITTETFRTFQKAHDVMREEMANILPEHKNIILDKAIPTIEYQKDFAIFENGGWCNGKGDADWLILCVSEEDIKRAGECNYDA